MVRSPPSSHAVLELNVLTEALLESSQGGGEQRDVRTAHRRPPLPRRSAWTGTRGANQLLWNIDFQFIRRAQRTGAGRSSAGAQKSVWGEGGAGEGSRLRFSHAWPTLPHKFAPRTARVRVAAGPTGCGPVAMTTVALPPTTASHPTTPRHRWGGPPRALH